MNTFIQLEGKTIKVAVPTLFIKELVLHETDLIAEIRSKFQAEDLVLNVDVKKELFPEYEELSAIKTKLTSREIYQKMVTKNPALNPGCCNRGGWYSPRYFHHGGKTDRFIEFITLRKIRRR